MEKEKKVNHTHTFYKQARKCVNIFICGFHLVALSQYLRLNLSVDLISININYTKELFSVLNLSSGCSPVGSLFTDQEQKRLAHD